MRLNQDLSIDEELVLLIYKELYNGKPFNINLAVEPLGLTTQHIGRMVRGLINRGYMIRVNSHSVDLLAPGVNVLPTNFIFTKDLSINDKRMVVLLHKSFINKIEIDTNKLHLYIPKELTINLIDTLFEEGVILHSVPLDFNDVFTLKSHYDA